MTKKYMIGALLTLVLTGSKAQDLFPDAEITNGIIRARLYLPDAENGYYRGSRFDWSGVMPELTYEGHSYFGQWFEKYDPLLHDAIMGPVEEFSPVGYDEAEAGSFFLKVGVGMLRKPQEPKYAFSTAYQIENSGSWKVKAKPDRVAFTQKLEDAQYAYVYKKTVQLTKGKPEMVLSHSLKNTGKQTLETSVYNHNFFVMDQQATGPDFVISLPFAPTGDAGNTASFGYLQENQILFQKELIKNEHLYYRSLQGFSDRASDYDIRIENQKTGAAVRITSDRPLSRLAFWSAPKTICPEPYIQVKIEPGETFTWNTFYQFYLGDMVEK